MKREIKQVLVSGSWYLIGNFLVKAVTFLSVSVFTRIMTVEDYGMYYSYLVYESFLTGIMCLGFPCTVKLAKFEYSRQFDNYIASMAGYTTVNAILLSLLCLVLCPLLKLNALFVTIALICSYCNCIYQLVEQRFIIENRYKAYIGFSFLFNIPQIILSIVFMLALKEKSTFISRIFGHAIPLVILYGACLCYIIHKGRMQKSYLNYGLKYGLPIILMSLASTILTQSDRLVIGHYAGNAEVGIYSGVGYVGSILYIVMLSMQNVWDRLFLERFTNKENTEIQKKVVPYVLLFMIPVIGMMALGKEISSIFLAAEYSAGVCLIIPLCLGWYYNFLTTILSGIEYACGKSLYLAAGTAIGALINIITNIIFVPRYGYEAAAITTAISYLSIFLFHLFTERRLCKTETYSPGLLMISAAVMCAAAILFQYNLENCFIRCLIAAVFIGGILSILLFTQKNQLRSLAKGVNHDYSN